MMPFISEHDREMMRETDKWMYLKEDGFWYLREDAPQEIKKHHKKMRALYGMFD